MAEFVLQWKVRWMLARSPSSPSTLASSRWRVDHWWCQQRALHWRLMSTNLESTSYWEFGRLAARWCSCGDTSYAFVDFGTSLSGGPHHGREVNCCFVEFVDHHLFQPRVHRRWQCHVQCRAHCRRCRLRAYREGSCDLQFGWNLLFRNDGV